MSSYFFFLWIIFLFQCQNSVQPEPLSTKIRGVSWVGQPYKIDSTHIEVIDRRNVNWIVQTPFGWQPSFNEPALSLSTTGNYWGETDEGLRVTQLLAQNKKIQTLLKPHIWLRGGSKNKWRSDIAMTSDSDWELWFQNYKRFINHYATLAEETNIPILCIGTELHQTIVQKPEKWRELIRDVRSIYSGKLTYAANWYQEYEDVSFWDMLDFIGIQAYFPLSTSQYPELNDLKEAWKPHLKKLELISKKYNKPILFTEIGYKSTSNAAIEPWVWPQNMGNVELSIETQTRCYIAFFEMVWEKPWFTGAFFWKWFPKHNVSGGRNNKGFTPQNKPAEDILKTWYSK